MRDSKGKNLCTKGSTKMPGGVSWTNFQKMDGEEENHQRGGGLDLHGNLRMHCTAMQQQPDVLYSPSPSSLLVDFCLAVFFPSSYSLICCRFLSRALSFSGWIAKPSRNTFLQCSHRLWNEFLSPGYHSLACSHPLESGSCSFNGNWEWHQM
jgi:hypothetical protein